MTQLSLLSLAAVGSASLLFSTSSSAQIASNNYGWSAWLGCWVAEGAPAREQLCIVPDGEGVRMITVVDGVARDESRVVADDREHAVAHDQCRGSERARWSNDRRRVFLNAELTCEDTRRVSSGLLAFIDDAHWVSVQSVTVDGQTATRSTRYALAAPGAVPGSMRSLLRDDVMPGVAGAAAAGDISDSDVSEASSVIADAAVEEWLRAADADYEVAGGSALEQLNRGGTVVVERPVYVDRPVYVAPLVRSCWDPFWGGFVVGVSRHVGIGVGYGSCGYHYYSRYSPWGYGLYGWRAYRPVIYVNGHRSYRYRSPVIIHRTSGRHRDSNRYRDRDDNWRDRSRDDGRDRDRGRATPNGYTRDRDRVTRDTNRSDTGRSRSEARASDSARSRSEARVSASTQRSGESRRAQPRQR